MSAAEPLNATEERAEPALSIRGLSKRFGAREALNGVGFDVRPGETVAVIGANGAGKTTLLSIVAGVQRADHGTVSCAPGQVGWVPQQPALYTRLSVRENLELFARLERVAEPDTVVARMLEQTGLQERAREQVARLSGGNRQRLNVALGLLADPPVLVLDEPSTALDPAQRERLWEFVSRLTARGHSVLFSTHIVGEAERYAERVVVLDAGEQLFIGPPAELAGQAQGDFEAAFLAFLRRHERERPHR